MNTDDARRILTVDRLAREDESFRFGADGSFVCDDEFASFPSSCGCVDHKGKAVLDGVFTADELEAMAVLMRVKPKRKHE